MTADPIPHEYPLSTSPQRPDRAAQRDFRRRYALAAATEVFVSRGYHATTMDEIAQRAGYTKPILYKQFSGKLDLYLAVLQDHIDTLTESLRQALASTSINKQRVRAAVQTYFDFVDHETHGFRLVFEFSAASEPSVQLRIGRATDACVDTVCEAVTHDSGLNPQQARLLAAGLVGASQVAAQYWLDTGRAIPKSDAIDAVIRLCWGGLSQVPLHPTE
ncbi:TetR/AcrR family transcriptional regulator [Nocardia sp. bgisy134]|uniref:TetR/AcrR family transcriptional regulator n=1 Tax=unclassified Nocardia TaxID=2637762 RepID=UPI003D71D100